ncbi:uncharacterized protein EAE98_008709 [Botrytis deweyae]|uniref:ABC transmembrane type-1 domain-containing protein n=1 Tax=Botrytis deweyae TaxID=2478750 RepID=A0ABQ7IDW6_9HELO|nr:uncharacterized protein EAE98_008709 [Botrytis deweyae]KAF7921283.1 hypothetical protein EAE98_008709 [Botrytis deweyae]
MSFDSVVGDYGQSDNSLVALLDKEHTTSITVQARILRTSFLKSSVVVPEFSKASAFKATLEVLYCQKGLFDILYYRIFCLNIQALGAAIILGAIFIMYS